MNTINVRIATIGDLDFIVSLLPRLTEFGPPAWRDINNMLSVDQNVIKAKLTDTPTDTVILIAENADAAPLGFIHVHFGNDYYYKEPHAHISDVITDKKATGLGVGQILMDAAETWARSRGCRWLTLSVFAQNIRARELYRRQGFGEDIMKYVKQL